MFIKEYGITILILAVIILLLIIAIIKLIKQKKAGRACNGGCADCPLNNQCEKMK